VLPDSPLWDRASKTGVSGSWGLSGQVWTTGMVLIGGVAGTLITDLIPWGAKSARANSQQLRHMGGVLNGHVPVRPVDYLACEKGAALVNQ
jgi:hypothetical protein